MEDGYLRFRYLERVESRIDTEKGSVLLVIEHFCVEFIYVKKVEFRARVSRIFIRVNWAWVDSVLFHRAT